MLDVQYQFLIPKSRDVGDIIAILKSKFDFGSTREYRLTRHYYDSFDWRLYRADSILTLYSGNEQSQLCFSQGEQHMVMQFDQETLPYFAADLPESPIRDRLTPLLDLRAMIEQITVNSLRRELVVVDDQAKTILTLLIEDHSINSPQNTRRSIGTTLTLLPVKGFEKPLERAYKIASSDLGLSLLKSDLLTRAMAGVGRQPMDYSSQLDIELDPSLRSDAATRIILHHLLGSILTNQEGVKANIDSEFLHDFRVAIRRTRAALGQIKNVFPGEITSDFKSKFAWLGRQTGLPRDLDVYLLKYPEYQAMLPPQHQGDLTPFHDYLLTRRQEAQKELIKVINSREYKTLLRDWEHFLETALPDQSQQKAAMRAVLKTADRRIWQTYTRALEEGRRIRPDSDVELLHELRITCKKLRYLMEFFQSLYPKKQIRALIKKLKALQDNLGALQDYATQEQKLREFSQDMMQTGNATAESLLAMGILVQNLSEAQAAQRESFAQIFADFDTQDQYQAFSLLFEQS